MAERRVTPNRFVDLAAFLAGYRALATIAENTPSESAWADDVGAKMSRHLDRASTITKRFGGQFQEGMDTLIAPIVAQPELQRFSPRLERAMRPGPVKAMAQNQVGFLTDFLPYLQGRARLFREVFPGKAFQPAGNLTAAMAEESPQGALRKLAQIPPISGLKLGNTWLKQAAELAGVPISDMEDVLTDAKVVADKAEQIRVLETRLSSLDPTSPEAVELQEEKQALLRSIEEIAEASGRPDTILSVVANKASEDLAGYTSQAAREGSLSPAQEEAMLLRGRGIIAAGAGSGKTRTLSAKVSYHIKELGLHPTQVMATSFSRDSAASLKEKIGKFGIDLSDDQVSRGFGTTHSIVTRMMMDNDVYHELMPTHKEATLVRLAMEQVMMKSTLQLPPPPPTSFFADLNIGKEVQERAKEEARGGRPLTFREALQEALTEQEAFVATLGRNYRNKGYEEWALGFLNSFFDPSDRFYENTMRRTDNLRDPMGLSDKQKDIIKRIFKRRGIKYDPSKDPNLTEGGEGRQAAEAAETPQEKTPVQPATEGHAASLSEGLARVSKKRDKDKGLREKYKFFSKPAQQWFNLGFDLTETTPSGKKKIMAPGKFRTAISKYKGQLLSPSQAYGMATDEERPVGSPAEAAVYAAYEWLKGADGETEFQGKGDFDDLLIGGCKLLVRSKNARDKVQSRYKCVLVDEAQDLNATQHVLFGLISGYLEPEKVAKAENFRDIAALAKADGSMTADTYTFIGDDKQAIYEFRGAEPELFIDASIPKNEGGGGFTTKLLEMNYRSGEVIVEAANRLIAHNKKQIPMTCTANVERKGRGFISAVRVEDTDTGAALVAEQIHEMISEEETDRTLNDFGVALRSNAEAYPYCIELLKKGIFFRCRRNPFNDPNMKAMLHWLNLASANEGDTEKINEAVLNAMRAPTFYLGESFRKKLEQQARGNYLTYLQDGGWQDFYGPRARTTENIRAYTETLTKVFNLKGLEPEQVFQEILDLTGVDGSTIEDAMIEAVENDDDVMAELAASSDDGVVTEEAVREQARAPVAPLLGLLKERGDLQSAMSYVDGLKQANEKFAKGADPSDADYREPAVRISTMHGWKGLECSQMYIPMVAGRFPRSDREDVVMYDDSEIEDRQKELESERRLAYVAITRGEDSVTILDIPDEKGHSSSFIEEACIYEFMEPGTEEAESMGKLGKVRKMRRFLMARKPRQAYTEEEMDAFLNEWYEFFNGDNPMDELEAAWDRIES